MKIKNMKSTKHLLTAITLGAALSFMGAGCEAELAAQEEYDIVTQGDTDDLGAGLIQELKVPGETFKLITEYSCDSSSKREWRITSDKFLYLTVYTEGLPADTKVWIDNIHIDTSIKSKYATFDGILQDSMDDHVHSSQLIGFPISNSAFYYGVFAVEGCNETFIKGTVMGYNGWHNGSIEEKRFTEKNYIEYGVWGNKFQIVYDLLVQGPNDLEPRNVSIPTDFVVPLTSTEIDYNTEESQAQKTYGTR